MKEEIESSNEELATVNQELQDRNQELNRLNDDLVNLLGSIDTVVVMVGHDLRIRRYTPRAEKVFNMIPADIGRPLSDIQLNLSVPGIGELVAEVIDSGTAKELEVQDKGGRWYSLRLRPYRTLDNKIDGAVLLLVDIDTLRRAREFAESIVATVREPLLVLDAELRVHSASRSYYGTFGSSAAQTEGRPVYDVMGGRWNVPALRRALTEVLSQGKPVEGFEVRVDDRGGERTLLVNARRLLREAGEPPLILMAVEDITDALALRESRERVAAMEEADRRRDEFLAMLAHELRNPLGPLRISADMLHLPAVDPGSQKRALEVIDRQLKTMTRLVDDLLDSARITQGKITLRREPVDLVAVLTAAASATRTYFGARSQEFRVSLPQRALPVEGDATRLEQIFVNLLHNASKYTAPRGHVSLSAELADGSGASPHVRVRVRDDGVGMSAEVRGRVFELFAQADRSLDHSQGGLGIGLTLARKLTELHGGTIEALSEGPGKGSEFAVTLPLGSGHAIGSARHGTCESKRAPRRVLVVDDNKDVTDSLVIALSLCGHTVKGAQDAASAQAAARELRPEVIVLDIGLPGTNGYDLARALRQDPVTSAALLVAMTGYGKEEDRRRSREAGFDHHLTKPIELEDLMRLFDSLSSEPAAKQSGAP